MRQSSSASNSPGRRPGRAGPRPLVQAAVLAALIAVPTGMFHLLCPFGGIETMTRVATQGLFVPKTGPANLVLLGAVLLSALVAGPVFCGWICPLGAVQDWTRSLAARLGARAAKIPERLDRALSLLRYLVLGLIVWATAASFNLVFLNADPYYALLHFWTGEVAPAALVVLGLVVAASVFVARPWCRWLCPLGGVLSFLGRVSLVKMRRPSASCCSCGSCAKLCPVGLDPSRSDIVDDPRCIRCGDCQSACPPKKARKSRGAARRPQALVAAALLAVFIAVPIIGGSVHGASRRQAGGTAELRPHAAAEPEAIAPSSIRAQSRLSDLPAAVGTSLEEIYGRLDIPEGYDPSTRLVDIEDDFAEKTFAWIKERLLSGAAS